MKYPDTLSPAASKLWSRYLEALPPGEREQALQEDDQQLIERISALSVPELECLLGYLKARLA